MDIKVYKASGILQDYAAGLASDQEQREVQCLRKIYPEIATALAQAEADLEAFAGSYAKRIPPDLRSKVLAEVQKHSQESPLKLATESVKPTVAPAPTISNYPPASSQSLIWFLAAASIVGIAFGVWQYTENTENKTQIAELNESNSGAADRLIALENENSALEAEVNDSFKPDIRKVVLQSAKEGGTEQLAVLWNTTTGEVKYNPSALPALPSDKQYQLWVLKDGVPADMGVVPKDSNAAAFSSPVRVMAGDAFAITVEPLGGNPSPSLDQLVVIGNV